MAMPDYSQAFPEFPNAIIDFYGFYANFFKAFFSIFGGGAQHAAKNRKKCQVFIKHFFRFLAAVRSTPPKIGKNAKFYGRNSAEFSEISVKISAKIQQLLCSTTLRDIN